MEEQSYHIRYLHGTEAEGLLYEIWGQIAAGGQLGSLFYDGRVKCFMDFRQEILRPGVLPFLCHTENGLFTAFSWLNDITSRMARTHFIVFRRAFGPLARETGRHLYRYILGLKDSEGYLLDCLYGITPCDNRLALRAALSCGWQKAGELPLACYIEAQGKSQTGVITFATRETLGIEACEEAGSTWKSTLHCS